MTSAHMPASGEPRKMPKPTSPLVGTVVVNASASVRVAPGGTE